MCVDRRSSSRNPKSETRKRKFLSLSFSLSLHTPHVCNCCMTLRMLQYLLGSSSRKEMQSRFYLRPLSSRCGHRRFPFLYFDNNGHDGGEKDRSRNTNLFQAYFHLSLTRIKALDGVNLCFLTFRHYRPA